MKTKTTPLQILLTKRERSELEEIRVKLGMRGWGDTIRFLIKKEAKK